MINCMQALHIISVIYSVTANIKETRGLLSIVRRRYTFLSTYEYEAFTISCERDLS